MTKTTTTGLYIRTFAILSFFYSQLLICSHFAENENASFVSFCLCIIICVVGRLLPMKSVTEMRKHTLFSSTAPDGNSARTYIIHTSTHTIHWWWWRNFLFRSLKLRQVRLRKKFSPSPLRCATGAKTTTRPPVGDERARRRDWWCTATGRSLFTCSTLSLPYT